MKALQAYVKGWSSVFRYKGMWLLFYLVNFTLAVLSAIPVNGFLGRTVGNSMSLGRSAENGFDYTFWGEMRNHFGDQINAIFDQTILFIIVFLLTSVFLMGGVLTIFKKEPERFSTALFWKGCSKYFWPLLRLTLYFLVFQGIVLLTFFSILSLMCDGLNPFAMESEEQLIDGVMLLGPIYLLVFTLVLMIQDYAKIQLVHQNPALLFNTFWGSFKLVFKNIGRFSLLYFLNIMTFLIAFGTYWLISDQFSGTSMTTIVGLLLIGQVFIISRIGIKLLNLSSANYLYQWTRNKT